jgi:predicted ATPase
MFKRLYVNNFKCLQNFDLKLDGLNSVFLLGKNGSGKTTIFDVIEIFQQIGRGTTSLEDLMDETSFNFGNKHLPIEFELEVEIGKKNFEYKFSVEFPEGFMYPRIKNESLFVNNKAIFQRNGGQTSVNDSTHFSLDWHHIGLPLISVRDEESLKMFRDWLRNIIILSPFPRHFKDLSKAESVIVLREAENIIDWTRWLLSSNPSLYITIFDFLKFRMPDLQVFKFEVLGRDDRGLIFTFKDKNKNFDVDFSQLSDGEKIFFLGATVIAAHMNNPTTLCLWDEPDNFVGLKELNHFITTFRKSFEASESKAQLIMTSHNERVVNNFSDHNIFVVSRSSHLSPTRIEVLENISYESQTVVDAFDNDELDR